MAPPYIPFRGYPHCLARNAAQCMGQKVTCTMDVGIRCSTPTHDAICMTMFYEILNDKRRSLLPCFAGLKAQFYLVGGTALALQIGHRDSIDFDFFSEQSFNTEILLEEVRGLLVGHTLQKTQDEKNTLSILVDGEVRVSFFTYTYPLIGTFIDEAFLRIASLEDIACMKLSAITGRASAKDYVDIFFLLKKLTFAEMLMFAQKKFKDVDIGLILKSAVYFDDITNDPINYTAGNEVPFTEVQESLRSAVKAYLDQDHSFDSIHRTGPIV